ncbi:MAG: response regulator [Candidatus Obscuribacterales bacterium]|jgi:CheY-like chemotaxis protein|nr:response regulator [Candidatus Obscuribacterales bacterium]
MINRVLVVEDNAVIRQATLRHLHALGINCYGVISGEEAIDLAEFFDLVLMDVQLPGISGIEASSEIRRVENQKNLQAVPIIAITSKDCRKECLAAGMDDYFEKPISRDQLSNILDDWLYCRPQKHRLLS